MSHILQEEPLAGILWNILYGMRCLKVARGRCRQWMKSGRSPHLEQFSHLLAQWIFWTCHINNIIKGNTYNYEGLLRTGVSEGWGHVVSLKYPVLPISTCKPVHTIWESYMLGLCTLSLLPSLNWGWRTSPYACWCCELPAGGNWLNHMTSVGLSMVAISTCMSGLGPLVEMYSFFYIQIAIINFLIRSILPIYKSYFHSTESQEAF